MERDEARRAFFRAFPTIAIAIFVTAIDQTITATALPAMATACAAMMVLPPPVGTRRHTQGTSPKKGW